MKKNRCAQTFDSKIMFLKSKNIPEKKKDRRTFFLWMWRFWMQYHLYGNVSISCILLYRLCRSKCIGSGNDYDGVKNF